MVTLTIDYDEVFNAVRRRLEYVGLKSGRFDQVRAIPQDTDEARQWYIDAVSSVCIMLDRLMASAVTLDNTSSDAIITLYIANNTLAVLSPVVDNYITAHITNKWLRMTAPDLLEGYAQDTVSMEQEIQRLAYFRKMPI